MLVALLVAIGGGLAWWHPWRNDDGPSGGAGPASTASGTQPSADITSVAPTDASTTPAPDPTPSATTSELAEAQAIDAFLQESAMTRRAVSASVSRLQRCRADESDAASFEDGTTVREDLIERLAVLDLEALPDAEAMRTDLELAWQRSADADRSYLAAYRQLEDDCSAGALQRSSAYADAVSLSGQSTRAKKRFVAAWNPVATQNSLPTRSDTEI